VIVFCYFCFHMLPDYPHKIFTDERLNFCLLIQSLAIDVVAE
jgi:hypothetical protein